MRDAASVLSRYRDQITSPFHSDIGALKRQILGELERELVIVPRELRSAIESGDLFTHGGYASVMRSLGDPSSAATAGRASTSYLSLRTAKASGGQASPGNITPSEAATSRRPARNDLEAQQQVDTLISGLLAQTSAGSNQELIEQLAVKTAKAARQLSCDLVNECGDNFRRSLNDIERRYTGAFTRSLQRIGINFEGGYFARGKIGKAGHDRLDLGIRADAELSAAFEAAHGGPITGASREQVVGWFMKQKPEAVVLERLAFRAPPSTAGEHVMEALTRALVSDATTRRETGEGLWSQLGHFAVQFLPNDLRGEPEPLSAKILEAALHRIGLEPHFSRQKPWEPGRSGSLERGRLALSIREDAELSAAFTADTKVPIASATADQIFAWFEPKTFRLDQILRIASKDLPQDERGLVREEIEDLIIRQAQSSREMGLALIVIRNSVEDRRDPSYDAAHSNLSKANLAARIQAHPGLAERIAAEKPKDVLLWFERLPADAATLIQLAGL